VKEKRSDWCKAIAGLAVVAVLAVGLGLLFRGQRPTPGTTEPTATVTATCTPAPTTTPAPTGTPPPRHLSAAVEVQAPQGFWLKGLNGDTVVGLLDIKGESQIVILDLVTGEMRQVSSATDTYSKSSIRISDRWVVWVEKAELADRSTERRLKVYDRDQGYEFELEAAPDNLDLSGNVVTWEEWVGGENSSDIFAYDLGTRTKVVVAERPGGQTLPRVSGSWIVYLEPGENSRETGTVGLRAHNLETGEDFLLDQACVLGSDGSGIHAISEGRVVWTQCTQTETDWEFRLLGVDLNGPRDEYFVNLPGWFFFKGLFGTVLAHRVGVGIELYDLERKEPLPAVDVLQVEVGDLFISGDRVVWTTENIEGPEGLHTAWIEQ